VSFFTHLLKKILGIAPACTAVIAAGGSSERMQGEDKLFAQLCGKPVLAHTLKAFEDCDSIDDIVIVTRQDSLEKISELCRQYKINKVHKIMVGGETRLDSVISGVFAVPWKTEVIAIHDGARPCIDSKTIERTIRKAAKRHAAAPGLPVSSTLKKVKRHVVLETIDRENVVEIQTPQTFNADLIKGALTHAKKNNIEVTDDCMAAELLGIPVYVTEGSRQNIKVTTREDLLIAEAILSSV